MECVNVEHFENLLKALSADTIDQILKDVRKVPNGQCCFRLPTPKNETERDAMNKFVTLLTERVELNNDPSNYPLLFPFLR